jgi:mono/diheme cytochrome c family protein
VRPATGMKRTRALLLAACALMAAPAAAQAPPGVTPSRGELLYATHCIACHTREIHWRQKKLAHDWASLNAQVRRWAANAGLGWSDEEIADVAGYLDATLYRFRPPPGTAAGDGNPPPGLARVR